MGLMINKNFNDKWIQKFINLLQGFFYAQYCPFGQEDIIYAYICVHTVLCMGQCRDILVVQIVALGEILTTV